MKTNEEMLRTAMDRRLSFLDELPSCRAAVQYRIAQEEEPVMKKKMSFGLVFAIVLILLSAAALAAGLLLSGRVSAARTADRALEKTYGITAEMQTFFARAEEELPDGSFRVTYTGSGGYAYPLGTYTAVVRDGKAAVTWSHDGEETADSYDGEIWGTKVLKQLFEDSRDEKKKEACLARASEITKKYAAPEAESAESPNADLRQREADKTAALKARVLSEDEMIGIGREFILSNYQLNDEQTARLELYTNSFDDGENTWYEMVNGKPCFLVEYLLYEEYTTEQIDRGESRGRTEKDGYYMVFVNVEDGTVEQYEYNAALAGLG